MADLADFRKKIDEIDEKIVGLIEERMEVSKGIAGYKADAGIPVFDEGREEVKLSSVEGLAHGDLNKKAVRGIYKAILKESKDYQHSVIEGETHGNKI